MNNSIIIIIVVVAIFIGYIFYQRRLRSSFGDGSLITADGEKLPPPIVYPSFPSGEVYSQITCGAGKEAWAISQNGHLWYSKNIESTDTAWQPMNAPPGPIPGYFAGISATNNDRIMTTTKGLTNVLSAWKNTARDYGKSSLPIKSISKLNDGSYVGIEWYSNQIWKCASMVLSGEKTMWYKLDPTNRDVFYAKQIIQLKDGTFAAIEYQTNQIWTSKILSGIKANWKNVGSVDHTKTHKSLSQRLNKTKPKELYIKYLTELNDGTFAAIEWDTNQIWTSKTLTNNKASWINLCDDMCGKDKNQYYGRTIKQLPDGTYISINWDDRLVYTSETLSGKKTDWQREQGHTQKLTDVLFIAETPLAPIPPTWGAAKHVIHHNRYMKDWFDKLKTQHHFEKSTFGDMSVPPVLPPPVPLPPPKPPIVVSPQIKDQLGHLFASNEHHKDGDRAANRIKCIGFDKLRNKGITCVDTHNNLWIADPVTARTGKGHLYWDFVPGPPNIDITGISWAPSECNTGALYVVGKDGTLWFSNRMVNWGIEADSWYSVKLPLGTRVSQVCVGGGSFNLSILTKSGNVHYAHLGVDHQSPNWSGVIARDISYISSDNGHMIYCVNKQGNITQYDADRPSSGMYAPNMAVFTTQKVVPMMMIDFNGDNTFMMTSKTGLIYWTDINDEPWAKKARIMRDVSSATSLSLFDDGHIMPQLHKIIPDKNAPLGTSSSLDIELPALPKGAKGQTKEGAVRSFAAKHADDAQTMQKSAFDFGVKKAGAAVGKKLTGMIAGPAALKAMKNPRKIIMDMILMIPGATEIFDTLFPGVVGEFLKDNPNLLIQAVGLICAPMSWPVAIPVFIIEVGIAIIIWEIQKHFAEIMKAFGQALKFIGKELEALGQVLGKFFGNLGGAIKKWWGCEVMSNRWNA